MSWAMTVMRWAVPVVLRTIPLERLAAWALTWALGRIGDTRTAIGRAQLARLSQTARHLAELGELVEHIAEDRTVTETEAGDARTYLASLRADLLELWGAGVPAKETQGTLALLGGVKSYADPMRDTRAGHCAIGCAVPLGLLAIIAGFILTGCTSMTEQKIDAYGRIAESYYSAPNVAELLVIEAPTGQTARIEIAGFSRLVLNTPVPPKTIIPREPTFWDGAWETIRQGLPWLGLAWMVHDGGLGGTHTTSSTTTAAP